ncbi:Ubiquitin-specific protease [Klebsormidium nitens]|uniref:Ubiquitin-specific protease n=1 Tax=Klebsormidium nitens TaxID=105231 RepID=A0A1Y1HTR9_KLENI|nr:Ubiquitin-specific protease [Klebsormidium nitens]|eukprot:GAQ79937.1 Ubiquitin-specific protease [Klebsormidium nitens]
MPPLSDSCPSEVSRKPSPARVPGRAKLSMTSNEPRSGPGRSGLTYPQSPSSNSRRQSPARTRPLTSNIGGRDSAFEGLGFGVPDAGDAGIRVLDGGKSQRAKSPYAARNYQSSGSPYLVKVYDVTPSQRSASSKGRSASRERAARMSTGKVSGVSEPHRMVGGKVTASEPTSPTAPASSSSVRGTTAMRKTAEKTAEGKGHSAYLERLSGEFAESTKRQAGDPFFSDSSAHRIGLEKGARGASIDRLGSVQTAGRSLAQGRSEVDNRGSTQYTVGVDNPGFAQDSFSGGNKLSVHQRFKQQREEALSGQHAGTSALGSQRDKRSGAEKQGLSGSRQLDVSFEPSASTSFGAAAASRAQLRKQSGLDDFAEISVRVEELLRVSRSHGADVSPHGSVPLGVPRSVGQAHADVSPGSSYSLSSASLKRPAHGASLRQGKESEGVKLAENQVEIAGRGLGKGFVDSSPLKRGASAGSSAAEPEFPPSSSAQGWETGIWRSEGGMKLLQEASADPDERTDRSRGGLTAERGSAVSNRGATSGLGRSPRSDVCTDVISDGDDISRGTPQRTLLTPPLEEERSRSRFEGNPSPKGKELTLDDVALSSSSESESGSEEEEFNPPAGGRRSRGNVTGTRGSVSSRSRGDVSSDVSTSPDRNRIRSPDTYGSNSPDSSLSPDSLLGPSRGDRFSSVPKLHHNGGVDFRIGAQPDTPPRRKSAKIVPISDTCIARPTVGLRNLGNTCFLNSILQCLISTPPLSVALVTLQDPALQQAVDSENVAGRVLSGGSNGSRPRLVGPLVRLLRGMTEARSGSSVNPQEFLTRLERWAPQFADGDQHDSQEALRIIMEALDMDCSRVRAQPLYRELASTGAPPEKLARDAWSYHRSRHDSVIQDIFSGQLQSTVECLDCGLQSHCFDPFLDLSLPLPKAKNASDSGAWFSPGRSVTLAQCLAAFTTEEELEEDHHCERCKAAKPATKKLTVFQLPRVLVLHIKRISGARFSLFSKDSTTVDFPREGLDMRPSLSEDAPPSQTADATYDLLAVSNHSGSMTGGHYTAYCKETASQGATWHCYNDSSVLEMSSSQVVTSSAYVLFYHKRQVSQ